MKDIIGFIGAGNMGSALIKGVKNSKSKIIIYDRYKEKAQYLIDSTTELATSVEEIIDKCNVVFLCVKPDNMKDLLEQINTYKASKEILFITIAAGKTIGFYENIINKGKFIRVMTNMPAAIGYGMSTIFKGTNASDKDLSKALKYMNYVGKTLIINDESYMNITTAIAGSGPAFVFMFIKSLINTAVKNNISLEDAKILACQMVLGSAKYALEQDKDMENLIMSICSPNGTTIEGVNTLKMYDFENIVEKAVIATKKRSIEMSGEVNDKCTVKIYTDGACIYNPGPGGYAAILIRNQIETEISGYKENSTNNEMELMAALQALLQLEMSCDVTVYSDSAYLVNAFNQGWIDTWKKNNWTRGKNEEIKNLELWKSLDEMTVKHNIKWVKVKGHSDNEYNNRCDRLANKAIKDNFIE
ncbi:MAG: Ribonuclease HI [Firmicutes bacterium ADurb.Bin146]|jgi:ribonuclease HI|nr:MAG: Ribonuclease HI [Firmicutes bacterium ADurb.Bin146]